MFTLFDKQWSIANFADKLTRKPIVNTQRIVQTVWFTLRGLKQNDQIIKLFNQTILWKNNDEKYVQSLHAPPQNSLPKKKKKKTLVKIGKMKIIHCLDFSYYLFLKKVKLNCLHNQ